VTRECTDCGQFYSCGQDGAGYNQRGNVFRNNRMEDSHKHVFSNGRFGDMQVFTFYLDDTMSGWLVENNTFVSCDIVSGAHVLPPTVLKSRQETREPASCLAAFLPHF
jgi:hypothetical protein